MKKMSLNKKIFLLEMVIIFSFLFLHSTPELAIRTYIFWTTRDLNAFTSSVEKKDHLKDNIDLYTVSPPAYEKATHSELTTFMVYKELGFIYRGKYYGEI